jgi:hypothetical protein
MLAMMLPRRLTVAIDAELDWPCCKHQSQATIRHGRAQAPRVMRLVCAKNREDNICSCPVIDLH